MTSEEKSLSVTATYLPDQDLASVACHAATQLDNIRIGSSFDVDAITQLVTVISDLLQPSVGASLPVRRPTTVAAMHRAIANSRVTNPPKDTLQDFITKAGEIKEKLIEVSEAPAEIRKRKPGTVEPMRDFCLAFSKAAASRQRMPGEVRSSHPNRR